MGQKVSPHGLRVGIIKPWSSRWFADPKKFADNLIEDHQIRNFLKKKLYKAGISKIDIERKSDRVILFIHTVKPGIIIGRGGSEIDKLKLEVEKLIGKSPVNINIVEVKQADLDAQIVAESIALQLEKRISFRRAMKQAMLKTMRSGAKGIKTAVSGRLGGAEIARTEHYHEGTIPLQTLRADISYGFAEANTTYGKIGVKVWICKGEILPENRNREVAAQTPASRPSERREHKPYFRRNDRNQSGFRRRDGGYDNRNFGTRRVENQTTNSAPNQQTGGVENNVNA